MQAINYVKKIQGDTIEALTPSGIKLAQMVVAAHGGIRETKKRTGVDIGVSTITKIVNGGNKGLFTYRSWEIFFNTLILKTA